MKKTLCLLLALAAVIGALSSCSSSPYDYDLSEYISLPEDWKNVEITERAINIRVSEKLRDLARLHASEEESVGSSAAFGDKVTLSFTCYLASDYGKEDAKPIDILSDDSLTLILGNLKYPYDFETSVVGHYINDKFQARTPLSSDIALEEYASAHVVYDVTLLSITKITTPTVNDSFIKSVTEHETLEEYKTYLSELSRKELIFESILERADIKAYPENELATYERNYIDYYSSAAQKAECTLESYLGKKFFMGVAEFHKEASSYAKEMVEKDLLLYYFIRSYNLSPTDAEYKYGAEALAKRHGFDSASALESKYGETFIRKTVGYEKVLEFLGKSVPLPTDSTDTSP